MVLGCAEGVREEGEARGLGLEEVRLDDWRCFLGITMMAPSSSSSSSSALVPSSSASCSCTI